jgi:hypothetical protein
LKNVRIFHFEFFGKIIYYHRVVLLKNILAFDETITVYLFSFCW